MSPFFFQFQFFLLWWLHFLLPLIGILHDSYRWYRHLKSLAIVSLKVVSRKFFDTHTAIFLHYIWKKIEIKFHLPYDFGFILSLANSNFNGI